MKLPPLIIEFIRIRLGSVYADSADKMQKHLDRFAAAQTGPVTPDSILEHRQRLINDGLKASTVNLHMFSIRAFCRWMHETKRWSENPMPTAFLLAQEKPERACITEADYHLLLDKARRPWDYAIRCAWATGARMSDVALMKYASHDPDRLSLAYRPFKTRKRGVRVEIPITQQFSLFLREFCPAPREYLCPEMAEQYFAAASRLSHAFDDLCKEAGVTGKTFHSFRHAFITRHIAANVNPVMVAEMAGVSLGRVMTYCHTSLESKRQALTLYDPQAPRLHVFPPTPAA